MQAVILAAGQGVRMRPLTTTVPKPLLKVAGKPLLDYTFAALPEEIDEVVVVIGYLGEQIRKHLGESFAGKKVRYIVQKKLEGTAKALWEVRSFLHGRFLVLMADDIYSKGDIQKCLGHEQAILVMKSEQVGSGGKVVLDEEGKLSDVIEGKEHPLGTLIATNVFVLSEKIFNYKPVKLTDREGEWGLPQTVVEVSKNQPVSVVEATRWIKITTPEDIFRAERILGI